MKRLSNIFMLLIALLGIASCSSDESGPSQADIIKGADGIITLTENIGNWDAAYVTNKGYFCYGEDAFSAKDNAKVSTKSLKASSASKYSNVTYTTADGRDMVSVLATKTEGIPTQLVTSKGIIYFSFPNDSILEVLFDNGKEVTMIDSIAYKKALLPIFNGFSNSDMFKAILANTGQLLNTKNDSIAAGAASIVNLMKNYAAIFEEISKQNYTDNKDILNQIDKTKDGDYSFSDNANQWYEENVEEKVSNTLMLWTGKATFKVGGSSSTLSGTIWCPMGNYNDYGTYGILCDVSKDNLFVGSAEYEGKGFQGEDDLSFGVDFRGFKPNTTYYYRAFYKFNGADHGGIVPLYGTETDDVIYDQTIKSFTTGDNMLAVDVVMCIDVTGSMSGIINTVKSNAIGFYDLFKAACDEEGIILTNLNAQVVAFRDLNVDYPWLQRSETYSLPEQTDNFKSYVNSLYASGGGDTPESGLEALDSIFKKTDWGKDDGYHRQVVILWTDAPYLVGESYANTTVDNLYDKWSAMPSGRRLILFAPNGSGGISNAGSWSKLDSWPNVIHETDLSNGFYNFEYILKSIIGELTSKSPKKNMRTNANKSYFFRPNK